MNNFFDKKNCIICPRYCKTDRLTSDKGFCNIPADYYVASITVHKGEEPTISGEKGICNIFFPHCNLQCVYCQNYQISDNKTGYEKFKTSLDDIVDKIIAILNQGIESVGFVSPSHFVWQTIDIIEALHNRKYYPTIVYNSNGYDDIETLKILEKYVDVYLPDFKYADAELGKRYSKVKDYPQKASAAIKEMFRQKGDLLFINKNGYAESGLIIRHLILPSHIENSFAVLEFIADNLSKDVHISLMSQYYPTHKAFDYPEIARTLTTKEYDAVVKKAEKTGFTNVRLQALESNDFYKPDFNKENPFDD